MINSGKLYDRLGIYIGKLRDYEGITQEKLAEGLCTGAHLARIESGEREADKLLTDALLQRLGKPADLFMRFLDEQEVQNYRKRKQILNRIQQGDEREAILLLEAYRLEYLKKNERRSRNREETDTLNQQFVQIAELNLCYLRGADEEELCDRVLQVLRLTQPKYGEVPLSELLLSRNEICLLMAFLDLKEKRIGKEVALTIGAEPWHELVEYLRQPRYEKKERVSLLPYVICHVAEQEYEKENLAEALILCDQAIQELKEEEELHCYRELLLLRQKISGGLHQSEDGSRELAEFLQELQSTYGKGKKQLWISYAEGDNVHSLGQVIAERRRLLGISQEELSFGICNTSTLSRIENKGSAPHKEIRQSLLQRVNLSGERYDYEIITGDYEDYLLRSRLGRAINQERWGQAEKLLAELRSHTPDTLTNRQYLEMTDSCIREQAPEEHKDKISLEKRKRRLWHALSLTLPTFPEEPERLAAYPAVTLSINEIVIFKQLASCYRRQGKQEDALQILFYLKDCMERVESKQELDSDCYTLCMQELASLLGDCGRYEESDRLSTGCLELLLEKQQSQRMASFLYIIAWNKEQQSSSQLMKEESLALMRKAYAAARLSGNNIMSQHIKRHCKQIYHLDLVL